MPDAKDLPAAIQWHEGMLLAPQHFQQMALRSEELLHYHLSAAAPFHWGVRRLRIDHGLLVDGTFRVLDLEAVMPDGLVVHHEPAEGKHLEIDIAGYQDEMKQKPVTVQLAVPALRTGAAAIRGTLARYDSEESSPVPDDNTGDSHLAIPRLVPRLTLLVTDQPPQKYCAFPLARVAYENETFALTEFIPPCLQVPVKSPLGEICGEVAHRIREKAVFLSEKVGSPAATVKSPMILETKLFIHAMVGSLSHFEAVIGTGVAHPYTVYLALTQLVGKMAALGLGLVPPILRTYNHNDPRAAFEGAKRYIFRMIDEGILESHTAIPFEYDNGVFSLKLEPEWVTPTLTVGVRGKPGAVEKEIVAWIHECLIGSEPIIEFMRAKRVLGAERKKLDQHDELMPARDVILFSITGDPEFIRPEETLDIINNADPEGERAPAEIVLYVKNPESAEE